MKIRTILPIVSALSVFAVPVLAQDAPAAEKKPDQAAEPVAPPPVEVPDAEPAAAPKAEATANVGATAGAKAEPKRVTLAAPSVTSRSGAESDAAAKEWKTDFHGYIRVP